VIEKHFTLDRNLPGPDHKASLEPDELHDLVKASQMRGGHMFTPDTIANKYTYQAALTAAGGSIQTGLNAKIHPSFAMLRPPGHHATMSTVMGFCFYNNIAITEFLPDLATCSASKFIILTPDFG